ncbi:MAG TPA: hypothetical protein VG273_25160 [Bryobacteraceae bacterium]|jgi:hypothetical protein|nr:hypothetical protein [Bryobacteraceae bacterium]
MSIGSIVNLASGYIESLFTGQSSSSTATSATPTSSTSGLARQGTGQISSFEQILSSLQQLQQANPSQYTQVTQQISSNLQTAAQSATAAGNTGLASEASQLSTDFKNASTSGQLPNVQDLAQAFRGGPHHHHHFGGFPTALNSTAPATATAPANNNIASFLQSLNSPQSLTPVSIIQNTLSSAGI